VLGLLNGQRSLDEVRDDLHTVFPYARPTLPELQGWWWTCTPRDWSPATGPGRGTY
jgi:hypothetical protein